ncbi:hypothetical protein YW5DRAFT_02279 [Streptomyces sp. Ncost-T6T-1]|nr:hypothetical protein YW5DRAFT_02279 [Streptomyces sp. Ncost-T6T-1]
MTLADSREGPVVLCGRPLVRNPVSVYPCWYATSEMPT